MASLSTQNVTDVHHWNDSLFSFKTTRDRSLKFENGHFLMLGIQVEGKHLMRAYSIASPNYDEELEFLSIKVADGGVSGNPTQPPSPIAKRIARRMTVTVTTVPTKPRVRTPRMMAMIAKLSGTRVAMSCMDDSEKALFIITRPLMCTSTPGKRSRIACASIAERRSR